MIWVEIGAVGSVYKVLKFRLKQGLSQGIITAFSIESNSNRLSNALSIYSSGKLQCAFRVFVTSFGDSICMLKMSSYPRVRFERLKERLLRLPLPILPIRRPPPHLPQSQSGGGLRNSRVF